MSEKREYVYHYTSLEALKSIVESKSLRLTDYRFLNDPNELIFGGKVLSRFVDKSQIENALKIKIVSTIKNLHSRGVDFCVFDGTSPYSREERVLYKYYTMSMTYGGDDLALWNMYAPNGICLKFNKEKLTKAFNKIVNTPLKNNIFKQMEYFYGDVVYSDYDKACQCYLDSILDAVSKNKEILESKIIESILQIKKRSFSYEKEYRFGLQFFISNQYLGFAKKIFTVSKEMIKPQLELAIPDLGDAIEEIIISPFIKDNIVKMGIEELLSNYVFKAKVKSSDIKVR